MNKNERTSQTNAEEAAKIVEGYKLSGEVAAKIASIQASGQDSATEIRKALDEGYATSVLIASIATNPMFHGVVNEAFSDSVHAICLAFEDSSLFEMAEKAEFRAFVTGVCFKATSHIAEEILEATARVMTNVDLFGGSHVVSTMEREGDALPENEGRNLCQERVRKSIAKAIAYVDELAGLPADVSGQLKATMEAREDSTISHDTQLGRSVCDDIVLMFGSVEFAYNAAFRCAIYNRQKHLKAHCDA